MAQQSVCAHCGFRNFSLSHFCARCEEPLREADQARPKQGEVAKSAPQAAPAKRGAALRGAKTAPLPAATPRPQPRPQNGPRPASRAAETRTVAEPDPDADGSERTEIVQAPRLRDAPRPPAPAPRPPPQVTVLLDAAAPAPHWATEPAPKPPTTASFGGPDETQVAQGQPAPTAAYATPPPPARGVRDDHDRSDQATQVGQMGPNLAWTPQAEAAPRATAPAERAERADPAAPGGTGASVRQALALAVDVAVVVGAMAAHVAVEMALLRGGWPSERATGLEAVAWWIYVYHRSVRRVLLGGLLVAGAQAAWGVRSGITPGRRLCGLTLVGQENDTTTRPPLPWGQAFWHLLGGSLCLLSLGAGVYWMVVDPRGRTWANLLSRTRVVRRV